LSAVDIQTGSTTSRAWHALPIEEIAAELGASAPAGLSSAEAAQRLARDGPNQIREAQRESVLMMLLRQFGSVVIWVLIAAALVSVALGERIDGAAILAIVILNAIVGFIQEYRAEQAVAALSKLTAPRARVIRDGQSHVVPAAEIVRGDLLVLAEGDLAAADARLLEASMLRVNEAPLTGESEPVNKRAGVLEAQTPLADRTNMLFLGTSVVSGSGLAVVVATGMDTEVGHIASLIETASSGETPLQRRLNTLGLRLLWACLAIVVIVFALGLLRREPILELFLEAVSLAVAAIPEGLPAVVTIALALGVRQMVRRRALVRRLPAVETLGSVQVICTDKTGTLTVGQMTARRLVTAPRIFNLTGEGYSTRGSILTDGVEAGAGTDPERGHAPRRGPAQRRQEAGGGSPPHAEEHVTRPHDRAQRSGGIATFHRDRRQGTLADDHRVHELEGDVPGVLGPLRRDAPHRRSRGEGAGQGKGGVGDGVAPRPVGSGFVLFARRSQRHPSCCASRRS